MKKFIRIATRRSPLALIQAKTVKSMLEKAGDFHRVDLVPMSTTGDTVSLEVFKSQGGKGLFLKELEKSLIKNDTDIAVHSLKDVPAKLDKRFGLLTFNEREDPSDVFISKKFKSIDELPSGSVLGTSSPRRIALLKASKKNIKIKEIRGNIQTRINQLKGNGLDGIILAAAGILRMSLENTITQRLSADRFIPSAGQGVLCVQYLKKNTLLEKTLVKHVNKNTQLCADVERCFVDEINGDCMSPIGINARVLGEEIIVNAIVSDFYGKNFIKLKFTDNKKNAKNTGRKLANIFLKQGAKKLLKMY